MIRFAIDFQQTFWYSNSYILTIWWYWTFSNFSQILWFWKIFIKKKDIQRGSRLNSDINIFKLLIKNTLIWVIPNYIEFYQNIRITDHILWSCQNILNLFVGLTLKKLKTFGFESFIKQNRNICFVTGFKTSI